MNSDDPTSLELPADQMRAIGYRVIDMLVDRYSGMRDQPVWTGATRAELDGRLHDQAPERGAGFDAAFERLLNDALPYGARVDHPAFMAFVPGAPSWPAVMGDLIATGTNTFQGTWLASSGASAIELVVIEWFSQWLGYDAGAAGLLVSGGSAANLTALATARICRSGGHDHAATIYCSTETHSSVMRAARTLGFHDSRVRTIAVDSAQRIDASLLQHAIAQDRRAGLHPLAVIANAGTTSTGAIDPLHEIADLCRENSVWLHVDAAYGGFAVLTQRGRNALQGIERADSIALDPHKWLYQPFETGCLLVREGALLEKAFSVMPPYLQDTALQSHEQTGQDEQGPLPVNFANRGIQLTRSARAIKVWLSIQTSGLRAFRAGIDRCMDLASYAEQRVRASTTLEIITPARLGIICFRIRADRDSAEALNRRALDALLASGEAMISSTRVGGTFALRICVLNYRTVTTDIDRVIDWFERFSAAAP